jgi:hypothetical protein
VGRRKAGGVGRVPGSNIGYTIEERVRTHVPRKGESVKIALNVLAVLLLLVGIGWILQGSDVLTQGVMAGHKRWILIGIVFIAVGVVILVRANLRRVQK